MSARRRGGMTMVEVLIAVSIVAVLTGIAVPAAMAIKRNGTAAQAIVELRAVDVAVNASCGRGICGPFLPSGSYSATVTSVPASMKEFLPSGYEFSSDTSQFAIELESWQFWGTGLGAPPIPTCKKHCQKAWAVAQGPDTTGFTNGAGFAAPATIYVTVWLVTRDQNIAEQVYAKAGGIAPIYVPSENLWKYAFPVLIGVPNTG